MNLEQEDRLDGVLAQAVQQLLDTPEANDYPVDLDALVLREMTRSQNEFDGVTPAAADSHRNTASRRRLPTSARILAGAVVVLACFAFWSMVSSHRSVLAEAIRRMEQAKSVRCVLESKTPKEEWEKTWEFEYERHRGFRQQHYEDGVVAQTEIDDGRHHWIHRQGTDVVTSGTTVNAATQLRHLLSPIEGQQDFDPAPAQDELLQGVACQCYVAEWNQNPSQLQLRVSIWVDHEQRARRFRMETRANGNDPWVVHQQALVEYDVAFDAGHFTARFPENLRIVDLSKLFDDTCSLEKAIHREVQLGYEFAVHDIRRIGLLEYYVLLSFRPTEQTRRQLKLGPNDVPGDLHGGLRSEAKHYPPDSSVHEAARELASARADGVLLKAFLCQISNDDGAMPIQAQPEFTVFTHAQLWNQVPAISEVSIKVPLPAKETPLNEVLRSIYDRIATLEATPIDLVQLEDEQDDRVFVDRRRIGGGLVMETQRKSHPRPSEIPFETFCEHLRNASWRKPVETREALADRKRQIVAQWGLEDPLEFLRELQIPDHKRPEFWHARLANLIKTPDPIVQLAAIEYAEQHPSLELAYFAVLPTFANSSDARVKVAADRLLAHYRQPVEISIPATFKYSLDFPFEQIERFINQLDHDEKVQESVKALRRVIGLDFGDGETLASREKWKKWWSHERESIDRAANGNREFMIYGQITNPEGTPLAGIPVQVHVSTRLFAPIENQAASTESDDNGRFLLRFGFFKADPAGIPIVNFKIQSTKFVTSSAWVGGNYVLSRFDLDADPHATIKKEGIVFSGQPKEMNIVQSQPDDLDATDRKESR